MEVYLNDIKRIFKKHYVDFRGRESRQTYITFFIAYSIAVVLLKTLAIELVGLFTLVTFLPKLSLEVRRLHDSGNSGKLILIPYIILIGFLFSLVKFFAGGGFMLMGIFFVVGVVFWGYLFYLLFGAEDKNSNKYGEPVKKSEMDS